MLLGGIALLILLLVAVGLPIAFGVGGIALTATVLELGQRVHLVAAQVMVDGLTSFVLIAAPFFMLGVCAAEAPRSG